MEASARVLSGIWALRRQVARIPLARRFSRWSRHHVRRGWNTVYFFLSGQFLHNELLWRLRQHWRSLPAAQEGESVVILAIIPWEFRKQRPQHLAEEWAAQGKRVWYVQPGFVHNHLIDARGRPKVRTLPNGVHVVQLPVQRKIDPYTEQLTDTERLRVCEALASVLTQAQATNVSLIVQHPFWAHIAATLPYACVYDWMDDHGGFLHRSASVHHDHIRLLRQASSVVVSSQALHDQAQTETNKPLFLVPNACDPRHFYRASQPKTAPITVGYFGALAHWFDPRPVAALAKAHPDWRILLIGEVTDPAVDRLRAYPNVVLQGEVPYARLPALATEFHVGIIPFRSNRLTHATSPVKFYEMMALGIPVVALNVPELRPYHPTLVTLTSANRAFVQAVTAAVDSLPNKKAQQQRQAFALQETWSHRAKDFTPALAACHPAASIILVSYGQSDVVARCLRSLERIRRNNVEVLVVHNFRSAADTRDLRQHMKAFPWAQHLWNSTNVGFAAANNQGLHTASGEHLFLLNTDTVVPSDWLDRMQAKLMHDESIGLLGPVTNMIGNEARVIFAETWSVDHYLDVGQRYANAHLGEEARPRMLAAFCWGMRREVWRTVGDLDEQFGAGMFEDDDYCLRVQKAGWRLACARDIFMYHQGRAAFSRLEQPVYEQLFATNKALFEAKWGITWQPHTYEKS